MARGMAWVWFLALVAALVAANPAPAAYQAWLATRIGQQAGTGIPALNRLAGALAGAAAAGPRHTVRTNIEVASVYTTSYGGRQVTVLGIAARFVPLRQGTPPAA